MRPTGEKAGLRRSYAALDANDSRDAHAHFAKRVEQQIARVIVADGADGSDTRAEGCEIIGGIGGALQEGCAFRGDVKSEPELLGTRE